MMAQGLALRLRAASGGGTPCCAGTSAVLERNTWPELWVELSASAGVRVQASTEITPPLFSPSNLESRMSSFPGRDAERATALCHASGRGMRVNCPRNPDPRHTRTMINRILKH